MMVVQFRVLLNCLVFFPFPGNSTPTSLTKTCRQVGKADMLKGDSFYCLFNKVALEGPI